ncbi:MAG: SpoIIE family protein phosphatase [Acidimicrobiia bacterium]|nr:SpoIIE family protein phosphatase [Acidimicrobiia bacterium]
MAVVFTDLHGRVVACNRHVEELYGWTQEELIGRRTEDLAAEPIDEVTRAHTVARIAAGEAWETDIAVRRKDGSTLVVHAVDSPFVDDDGTVTGVVSVSFDITDRRRAEDVQHFLADTTTLLMGSLDFGESLRQLAAAAVPFLGDICLVDIADGPEVVRMAAVHADPGKQALVDILGERYPPDPVGDHPAVRAMVTGIADFSPEMTDEFLRATCRDDEHLELVRRLEFSSYICVPLVARGKSLGALTLVSCSPERRFGTDDLALAQEVAWRAALAVDNARLFSERAYVARTLQASLLPHTLPAIPGVEVAARYLAAGEGNEVGGDFFDAFDVGYGTWAVVIGDVCGKGADAAAIAGLARHTVRAAALKERRPSRVLSTLNDAILGDVDVGEARFCTVVTALVRPNRTGARMTIATGGHPLAWLLRADGTTTQVGSSGLIVGVFPQINVRDEVVNLRVGDAVVFYTDGVVEERDDEGRTFGQELLQEVLEASVGHSATEIVDEVVGAVTRFSGREPRDDVAVVVLRVVAPS